jgi:hypothetical protein
MKSWDIVRGMQTESIDMGADQHCMVIFEVGIDKLRRKSADHVLELERRARQVEKAQNVILDSMEKFSNDDHEGCPWVLIITPNGVHRGMHELMGLLDMSIGELWHHGHHETHLKWYIDQSSIIDPGVVVGNVLDMLMMGEERMSRAQRQNIKRTW